MKNVNPMMVVAVLLWVVCGAAWAGGSIEFTGGGGGLPTTGGTMTGQQVFSGVSTDISTGSGESFTVAPSGAGGIDLQVSTGDINVDTTTGNMTLDCTTANAEGCLRITHAETNGNGIWLESTSGNNTIRMRTPTNTASVALDFISSTSARSAQFAYTNASSTNTDYANKVFVYTNSVEFRINEVNNIAAGTDLFSVNDTAADGRARPACVSYIINSCWRISDAG